MNRLLRTLPLLAALLLVAACGPKPEPRESVLDSPDYHVSQGLKQYHAGRMDEARIQFDRALALEPGYARALSGLALVEAAAGDFSEAMDLSREAIEEDAKDPLGWAVRGRVRSLREEPGQWDGEIEEDFRDAVKRDESFDLAWYWWGKALQRAWRFEEAERKYARAIELRGAWAAEADDAYQEVQDIVRAAPGTRVGQRIVQLDTLTRADLAVLFLEELKLTEVMQRHTDYKADPRFVPPADPTELPEVEPKTGSLVPEDIQDHWASSWIVQIIDMGVMEIAPDRRFYPDQPVSRAEFALFLQNILATVLHDDGLTTRYIGERSRFSDMRNGTATYNAAALAIDRDFMDADLQGRFHPAEPVSGAEALLSIRDFQDHLEFDF